MKALSHEGLVPREDHEQCCETELQYKLNSMNAKSQVKAQIMPGDYSRFNIATSARQAEKSIHPGASLPGLFLSVIGGQFSI
jgi:hypothetical protein